MGGSNFVDPTGGSGFQKDLICIRKNMELTLAAHTQISTGKVAFGQSIFHAEADKQQSCSLCRKALLKTSKRPPF